MVDDHKELFFKIHRYVAVGDYNRYFKSLRCAVNTAIFNPDVVAIMDSQENKVLASGIDEIRRLYSRLKYEGTLGIRI